MPSLDVFRDVSSGALTVIVSGAASPPVVTAGAHTVTLEPAALNSTFFCISMSARQQGTPGLYAGDIPTAPEQDEVAFSAVIDGRTYAGRAICALEAA
jgi:hypothetical protein